VLATTGVTFGLAVSSSGLVGASTFTFSANAHRGALIKVLDTHAAKGSRINELSIAPSPRDGTWVYYRAGFRTSGGEDLAEGFAHWAKGTWHIVYGPWSQGCGPLTSLTKIPPTVRASFTSTCT
jgi:hypothetical protein